MSVESYFWWTKEQVELSNELENFVEKNMIEAERAYWAKEYPHEMMNKISEAGLMRSGVPKEYGGLELGATGCCIVAEQLGRMYGVGNLFVITMLAGLHQLITYGTPEQKQKWLPQIASGKTMGTICITEPFAGSDAMNINTTAEFIDGEWIIKGKKRMVSAAGVATRYLVYARTKKSNEDKNFSGITAFMVEKGMPGFHVEKINALIGYDNIPNGYLDFDHVKVPDENRIGKIGSGWEIMNAGLNFERLIASAVVSGSMLDTIRLLLYYTDRRVQFKQTIGEFSSIQMEIADFVAKWKMSRLYTYHTAAMLDKGMSLKMDEPSIAKLFSTKWASELGIRGVQLMGGDGLTKFYPAERTLREAKIGEIVAGTNEIQRLIVYRIAKSNARQFKYPFRVQMDPETNVPLQTSEQSPFYGIDINPENMLKVLAEDYRCNPALCMSIHDLIKCTGGNRKDIKGAVAALEEQGLVFIHRSKNGRILLVKANYEGLNKAYPKEHYKWFPKNYDENDRF